MYAFIRAVEGGYQNRPDDHGEETKYETSHKAFPTLEIASLKQAQAKALIYEHYWVPIRGESEKWGASIRLAVLDYAVHSGVRTAVRPLQKLLQVKTDGIVGPVTPEAIHQKADNDSIWSLPFLASSLSQRREFLARLVVRDPTQMVYLLGWTRRVNKLEEQCLADF